MRISREEVQHVAALARIELTPDEETALVTHFDSILTYMEKLNQLNTDTIEPTAHAIDVSGPLREDTVTNQPNTRSLLENAPDRYTDFFKVPRIIE